MPKLIDSEIRRIDTKAKEISTAYSLFLLGQKKFRVLSNEAKYFQSVLNILVTLAVDRCFSKEDAGHLATGNLQVKQKSIDFLGPIHLILDAVGPPF